MAGHNSNSQPCGNIIVLVNGHMQIKRELD